ncbi:MAG TPA: hypothetical protein VFV19_18510 [Candidatus Polarisedimenticolaceae bacterium]|nr:hypothetical protein [Candidatus Polarisedimenticolaceae bacterium]
MRTTLFTTLILGWSMTALADAEYVIADTHADVVLSLDPHETLVYMNTFPVDPSGQYIDLIRTSYGRVFGPSALNGTPVKILLYEDPDGGSPQNATLLWSQDAVVANGNTDTLNQYVVPHVLVHGTLVAAIYFQNTKTAPVYITPLDTTAPTYSQQSYFGYVGAFETLDPANLSAIPLGQFMAQEDSGPAGNYRIEARGRSDDGIALTVSWLVSPDTLRLTWTGGQPPYDVERASQPDFSDAVVIAPGVTSTTYDDPVAPDGPTCFYRVR